MSRKSTAPVNYDNQIAQIDSLINKWNGRISNLSEQRKNLTSKKKEADISYLYKVLEEKYIPIETAVNYFK
jgi:hypothetical protein